MFDHQKFRVRDQVLFKPLNIKGKIAAIFLDLDTHELRYVLQDGSNFLIAFEGQLEACDPQESVSNQK